MCKHSMLFNPLSIGNAKIPNRIAPDGRAIYASL